MDLIDQLTESTAERDQLRHSLVKVVAECSRLKAEVSDLTSRLRVVRVHAFNLKEALGLMRAHLKS